MFDFLKKKNKSGKQSEKGGGATAASRADLIAQAQENARKARAEIGDENIQKLAQALQKMNNPDKKSDGQRAREQIMNMDKGHVADNLKIILKEDKERR